MNPQHTQRVAIVGCGMVGKIHRRASQLAGGDLVGVIASSVGRTQLAAALWNTAPLASVVELKAVKPDVVHVCTPNAFHEEYVEAAFIAGAHVICEKPLGTSVEAARRLAELARSTKRVASIPFVYRFHPHVRELRARIAAGELGRLQLVHGSYLQDWLLAPLSSNWRVDARVGGPSRAFADIGSHWCDLMEFVTGERIAALSAAMTTTVPERPAGAGVTFSKAFESSARRRVDTEDAATVLFRTHSGVLGSVVISQVSAGRKNRLWIEIDGAERSAVFDQENAETLRINSQQGGEIVQRDPERGAPESRRFSHLPPGHTQGYTQCFEDFIADTYASMRGEAREGLPTFADGLRSAEITDAVIRSSANGSWVEVGESA